MARVFLSHADRDSDLAVRVRDWLIASEHEVFLASDPEGGVPSGGLWKEHLYERLRWGSALVCVVTDAAIASRWCFAEVVAAQVVGCSVVPLAAQAKVVHPLLEERQHIAIHGAAEPAGRQRLLAYLRDCDVPGAAGWPDDRSPFPGLRPFEPDMHQAFFGRQAETDAVLRLLRSAVERDDRHVLAVVGPSGCGKSSLVRAGVLAAISREAGWAVVAPASPGAQPLAELARSFAQAMPAAAGWSAGLVRDRLATDGLLDVATDFLIARPGPAATRLLLVIDQFEEVLTRADATGRQQLATVLTPAVDAGVVRVVTTMRSEFLDPLLASGEFAELPIRSFPLRPLDPRMLPTVIEAPMRLAGLRIAPSLVSRMTADTDSGESLPLLAYTLQQVTTGLRRGTELTALAYDNSGGVRGTLIREADAALAEAVTAGGRSEPDVLRTLLRLVTVDDTGHTSRLEVPYHLFNAAAKPEVDTFIRHRLLTIRTERHTQADEAVLIAGAHKAFLREWPLLATMVESHRATLRMRVTLEDAAAAWTTSQRHRSYLWDRTRLTSGLAALGAALRRPPIFHIAGRRIRTTGPTAVDSPIVDLSSRAMEFVADSDRRNQQRRRRATVTVAAVLTMSLVLTGTALWQRRATVEQRQATVEQRELAVNQQRIATARETMARAEQLRGSNVRQALKLGLAAERIDSTPSTRTSLATTLANSMLIATMSDEQGMWAETFSPDGQTLAIATSGVGGGTVQLWDVTNRIAPTRTATIPHDQRVTAVAFSPDGHTLAATTSGSSAGPGTVHLWDVTNRSAPTPTGTIRNDQSVTAVAFGPDGRTLGIGIGGTVQLWDVTNRTAPTSTATIPDNQHVTAVTFSPDGHTLATTTVSGSGPSGTVQLWDVTNPATLRRTATVRDDRGMDAVAFSPDGHTLATNNDSGAEGGTVQLWDVTNRTDPTRTIALAHDQHVTAVAFSPDGHTLATNNNGVRNGTVHLWDVTNRTAPTRTATIPHDQYLSAMTFSSDGHTLATITRDSFGAGNGTAQLWDLTTHSVPTRTAVVPDDQYVTAVAFSADGQTLAATTSRFGPKGTGTVQLWDVTNRTTPTPTATIPDNQFVTAVTFSPDGHTLATTTSDVRKGTVRLWDLANRTVPTRTATIFHDQRVTAAAFSPDGHTLPTTTTSALDRGGGTVQLWDVTNRTTPTRTATIPDNQHVTAVTFSPDGHTLATTTSGDIGTGG